jgi:hypothetical protein
MVSISVLHKSVWFTYVLHSQAAHPLHLFFTSIATIILRSCIPYVECVMGFLFGHCLE